MLFALLYTIFGINYHWGRLSSKMKISWKLSSILLQMLSHPKIYHRSSFYLIAAIQHLFFNPTHDLKSSFSCHLSLWWHFLLSSCTWGNLGLVSSCSHGSRVSFNISWVNLINSDSFFGGYNLPGGGGRNFKIRRQRLWWNRTSNLHSLDFCCLFLCGFRNSMNLVRI